METFTFHLLQITVEAFARKPKVISSDDMTFLPEKGLSALTISSNLTESVQLLTELMRIKMKRAFLKATKVKQSWKESCHTTFTPFWDNELSI